MRANLNRCLHRLGARVAQKRARHPGRRDRGQRGQQLGAAVVVEDLGAGDELRRLLRDGRDDGGVRVAQVSRALAAGAVDVFVAIGIPNARTLSPG